MIKIFLTDDQTLFLETLSLYLKSEPEIEVIGTSVSGKDTLTEIKKNKPDLLLLDLKLPDISGLEVSAILKKELPDLKIIILSSFENENDMISVVDAGIDGYIIKDIPPDQLILVIKTVCSGFTVLHPGSYEIMRNVIRSEFKHYSAVNLNSCHDFSGLAVQEQQIIRLITEGKSNKEIASLLDYTEGTVKNYLSRILQKTGCRDRTHLAVQALRKEFI